MDEFASFACLLADAARAITLKPFDGHALDKAGNGAFDPVTDTDIAVETRLSELIRERYPDHSVTGEELGASGPEDARFRWSLDPIDGTRSYICNLPYWVTLVALLDEGRPVLGLIDVPRLDERYLGIGGEAALIAKGSREALKSSACTKVAEARLSTTDPYLFEGRERDAFERVRSRARVTRFGLDGFAYARLAAGGLDLVIESGLKPHDLNALVPVVRGSGGVIGSWSGDDDFSEGAVVAAATADLYAETVGLLAR
jgi:myo-inositol-1(or 4)-monophosphatase